MMIRRVAIYLSALSLWLWAGIARAETVLVTPAELPPSAVMVPRGATDRPKVVLSGPDSTVKGGTPFALKAVFTPRPDLSVEAKSVHVILLRGDGVDAPERVRTAGTFDQSEIDLTGQVAPPAEYRVRVTVEDTRARPSFTDITLKIDAPQ